MSSFLENYEQVALLGKALEIRWFGENGNNDQDCHNSNYQQATKMPFLRRNLTYSRWPVLSKLGGELEHNRTNHNANERREIDRERERQRKRLQQKNSRSKLIQIKKQINLLDDARIFYSKNHRTTFTSCLNYGTKPPPSDYAGRRRSISPIATNSTSTMEKKLNAKQPKQLLLSIHNPPARPKHSFEFFCEANKRMREEELVGVWHCKLSDEEKNHWIWNEIKDRRRYIYQKKLVRRAASQARKGCVMYYYFCTQDESSSLFSSKLKGITTRLRAKGGDPFLPPVVTRIKAQIEKRMDRRCPFCFYDGVSNRGLLLHFKTVHNGDCNCNGNDNDRQKEHAHHHRGIVFNAGIDAENNLHVTVKSLKHDRVMKRVHQRDDDNFMFLWRGRDQCHIIHPENDRKIPAIASTEQKAEQKTNSTADTSTITSKTTSKKTNISIPTYFDGKINLSIPFVKKPTHLTCGMETTARKRKIRQLGQQQRTMNDTIASATTSGSNQHQVQYQHPKAILEYVGDNQIPIRQYYHSKTMQPMAPGDWDVDSDDDEDDGWLHALGENLMNELGDVSSKEKKFMNMWNRFMFSHTVVADHIVPRKCEEFISKHILLLIQHDLRQQFMLHLFNLWDNGLLPSNGITVLMKRYDSFSLHEKENREAAESLTVIRGDSNADDLDHDIESPSRNSQRGMMKDNAVCVGNDEKNDDNSKASQLLSKQKIADESKDTKIRVSSSADHVLICRIKEASKKRKNTANEKMDVGNICDEHQAKKKNNTGGSDIRDTAATEHLPKKQKIVGDKDVIIKAMVKIRNTGSGAQDVSKKHKNATSVDMDAGSTSGECPIGNEKNGDESDTHVTTPQCSLA